MCLHPAADLNYMSVSCLYVQTVLLAGACAAHAFGTVKLSPPGNPLAEADVRRPLEGTLDTKGKGKEMACQSPGKM